MEFHVLVLFGVYLALAVPACAVLLFVSWILGKRSRRWRYLIRTLWFVAVVAALVWNPILHVWIFGGSDEKRLSEAVSKAETLIGCDSRKVREVCGDPSFVMTHSGDTIVWRYKATPLYMFSKEYEVFFEGDVVVLAGRVVYYD